MKTSPSLLVRNFLKAIHPPLPPTTARETKKLVGVLESAFQKHLDETHPSPQSLSSHATSHESNSIPDPAHQATRATHTHLASLLAHPLLQKQSISPDSPHSLTATAVAESQNIGSWKTYDFALVQRCCRMYLNGLKRKEVVPQDRRLGPRLLSWYTHMSPSDKYTFLSDSEVLQLVVAVLYADQLESVVWDMLSTLYERPSVSKAFAKTSPSVVEQSRASLYQRAVDNLISLMIHQTALRGSIADAAQQFIQACKYYESRTPSDKSQSIKLGRSWNRLAQAILDRRSKHNLSPELFDEIILFGTRSSRPWTWVPSCLQLYHPTTPSYKPLISLLKTDNFMARSQLFANGGAPLQTLSVIIDDAVTLCESQGRSHDAQVLRDIKVSSLSPSSPREKQSKSRSQQSQSRSTTDPIENFDIAWT